VGPSVVELESGILQYGCLMVNDESLARGPNHESSFGFQALHDGSTRTSLFAIFLIDLHGFQVLLVALCVLN
jgi:hypothetical protein